ncbi:hypothetical protein AXG93_2852s1500 [Marchantia polymorpha subsp. ruderalis]|uniref:Uncharacterized protein n=1 Tax=Marchantia polymorpha subsp. ruderalis TaxID=1480154 RepID=A0A176WLC3_MARPO|nr:hypothetical protein AXG93_2852s1500 [Marchantia polymorpha subsp. ruderalis]
MAVVGLWFGIWHLEFASFIHSPVKEETPHERNTAVTSSPSRQFPEASEEEQDEGDEGDGEDEEDAAAGCGCGGRDRSSMTTREKTEGFHLGPENRQQRHAQEQQQQQI